MESTTVSMRVGSCHETTEPGRHAHAVEAGGDPLGPVAELAERDRLAVGRDEHGVVGRRLRPGGRPAPTWCGRR